MTEGLAVVHYVADDCPGGAPCSRALCGAVDVATVWRLNLVSCAHCRDVFDRSLLALRHQWARAARHPRGPDRRVLADRRRR